MNTGTATRERARASSGQITRSTTRRTRPATSVRGRRIAQAEESGITLRQRAEAVADNLRKVPFVAVIVLLLAAGIGFTLFLSGRSTEDTYALRTAQQYNDGLVEQKEQLLTEIEGERSAESLARKAEDLGLVSVISAPMIVRNPDGTTRVEGPEEAEIGDPVRPLQPEPSAPAPRGGDAARTNPGGNGAGERFSLPPGMDQGAGQQQGGLTLPYPNQGSPVPDLGAGRRIDTLPAATEPEPAQPQPAPAAPAPQPAPLPGPPEAPVDAEQLPVPPADAP